MPLNKKQKRHSGWVYPQTTIKEKKEKIIDECLDPQPYYDDWENYRDGFRDYMKDRTKKKKISLLRMYSDYMMDKYLQIIKHSRRKIKKHELIRKLRKNHNI